MKTARTLFSLFVVTVLVAVSAIWCGGGCAALSSVIPVIMAMVVDGMQVIDAIAAFVARHFAKSPDPAAQAQIDNALAKCRAALNVALRSAQGAENISNEKVDAAFADFKAAYLELLGLVRPFGVVQGQATDKLSASPVGDKLVVPPPLAFRGAR